MNNPFHSLHTCCNFTMYVNVSLKSLYQGLMKNIVFVKMNYITIKNISYNKEFLYMLRVFSGIFTFDGY